MKALFHAMQSSRTAISIIALGSLCILFAPGNGVCSDKADDPFHLKTRSEKKETLPLAIGAVGTTRSGTDGFERGWGGAGIIELRSYSPLLVRATLTMISLRIKNEPIKTRGGGSIGGGLSMLFQPALGLFSPYVGAGISFLSNSTKTDELPPNVVVVNDHGDIVSEYREIDLGSAFGLHVLGGINCRLSRTVSLVGEIQWQEADPSIDVQFYDVNAGDWVNSSVSYDYSTLNISIGFLVGLAPPD